MNEHGLRVIDANSKALVFTDCVIDKKECWFFINR